MIKTEAIDINVFKIDKLPNGEFVLIIPKMTNYKYINNLESCSLELINNNILIKFINNNKNMDLNILIKSKNNNDFEFLKKINELLIVEYESNDNMDLNHSYYAIK